MPDPTAPELVAKTIVKEAQPTTATTSSEKMVAGLTAKLQEQGYRTSLEMARGPHVDGRKLGEKIDQIGTDRDPATGAKTRTPDQQRRFDEATATKDLLTKFLDGGLDKPPARGGLTNVQKLKLEQLVSTEIMKRPDLAREINAMTAAQQKAFMERYMRDARFAEKAREILDEIATSPELPDTVSDKKDLVTEKELERDVKQSEMNDVDRRIASIDTRLAEFARPGGGAAMGARAQELDTLKTNLTTMKADLRTQTQARDNATFRIQQLDQERQATLRNPGAAGRRDIADIDNDIAGQRTNQTDAQAEVDRLTGSIDRIPQLEQEERQLEEQKVTLSREKNDRQIEMNKIVLELSKRQREYQDAVSVRASAEQDIVDRLNGVAGEAVSGMIDDDIRSVLSMADTELQIAKDAAKTQAEKDALDTLKGELTKVDRGRRWGKKYERTVIDKAKTNFYFGALMKGGPEPVMRGILLHTKNPETGAPYTETEVTDLMKNKEFVDSLRPQMVKQVMTRKILTGGIAQEDVFNITNSDWGQGMIEQAMTSNDAFKKAVEDVMGKDALKKPGFAKRLAVEMGRPRNILLLLLLGVVGGVAVGGYGAHQAGKMYG